MPGLVCVEFVKEKMIPCQDFSGYCGLAISHHSGSVTYWAVIIVQNVVLPFRVPGVWCSNLRLKNFYLRFNLISIVHQEKDGIVPNTGSHLLSSTYVLNNLNYNDFGVTGEKHDNG